MAKAATTEKEDTGFTVTHLAEALGIDTHATRTRLRTAEIGTGENGRYHWPTQKAFDAVVKQLSKDKPANDAPKASAKKAAPKKAAKKEKVAA